MSKPLFAGVLAEVVCTQTLSELLLRPTKNTYAKTCDLLLGAYEASAARDRHRQRLVGGVFW